MNTTNEIKAKVFAQYLGQKWQWDLRGTPILKLYSSDLTEIERFEFGHNVKLILKPLSAITDEDAIEAGELLGIYNRNIPNAIGPFKEHKTVSGLIIAFFCDKLKLQPSNLLIATAYQYLISKGYDLPHYLLGGKTLHKAGLAIYENEK